MSHSSTPTGLLPTTPDWETLARWLAGESPAGEAAHVRAWLAAHPADARLLGALDLVATSAAPIDAPPNDRVPVTHELPPPDVERALRRVQARRDEPTPPLAAPSPAGVRPLAPRARPALATAPARRWWPAVAGLAAAAVLVLALGLWSARPPAASDVAAERPAGAAAAPAYATAVGERDSLRLPDGTRIVLAPDSRLTVAAAYGGEARDVVLEGMAWFSVVHDAARPFTVRAGNSLVRDIGTEFVVRTEHEGAALHTSVVVTDGVVELRAATPATAGDSGVVLAAGDRAMLRDGQRARVERGVVTADDVAWTRGRLVYRGATLAQVGADLRRWYGVELRVTDSVLAARRVTTTIEDEPVEAVLARIALALGARVERDGAAAVLRPAGGGAR